MKQYRLLCLFFTALGASALVLTDANAATRRHRQPTKIKILKKSAPVATPLAVTAPVSNVPVAVQVPVQQTASVPADVVDTALEAALQSKLEAKREAEVAVSVQPIMEAESLMKAGKAAEAYTLLLPLEFDRSGDKRFDYLLGIAALDSGKSDKATIAFERVLAVDPNFAGARLDMARAYFQLGDMVRAKTEFEAVNQQNPPEAAKVTIRKYLDTIQAMEDAKKTQVTGYVEGTAGHDGNVASATDQQQTIIGNIKNTLPDGRPSVKMRDAYYGVAAGGELMRMVTPNMTIYGGVDVSRRRYSTENTFNTSILDVHAGSVFSLAGNVLKLGMSVNQFSKDNKRVRDLFGLSSEFKHAFNPNNQFSLTAQYSQSRYVDPHNPADKQRNGMSNENSDNKTIGAAWLHVLPDGKSVLFGSVFYGEDKVVSQTGGLWGDRRFNSVRVGGQTGLSEKWDGYVTVGAQNAKFTALSLAMPTARRVDTQYDVTLGATWSVAKSWSLRPQLSYTKNRSNSSLFVYDRTDFSVTLRKDFK